MRWRLLAKLRAFFCSLFQFRCKYLNTKIAWISLGWSGPLKHSSPPPRHGSATGIVSVPSVAMRSEIKEAMNNLGTDSFGTFLTAAIIRPDLELTGRRTEQIRRLTPSRWVAIPEYFLVFLVKLCRVQFSDGNSDLPHHRQPHSPGKNMHVDLLTGVTLLQLFTVVEHSGDCRI